MQIEYFFLVFGCTYHFVKKVVVLLLVARIHSCLVRVLTDLKHLSGLKCLKQGMRSIVFCFLRLEYEHINGFKTMLVELHPVFAQVYNVPLIVNVVYCFHRRLFQVTAIGSLTHGLAADVWTFWRFFGLLQIFVNASRVV